MFGTNEYREAHYDRRLREAEQEKARRELRRIVALAGAIVASGVLAASAGAGNIHEYGPSGADLGMHDGDQAPIRDY